MLFLPIHAYMIYISITYIELISIMNKFRPYILLLINMRHVYIITKVFNSSRVNNRNYKLNDLLNK